MFELLRLSGEWAIGRSSCWFELWPAMTELFLFPPADAFQTIPVYKFPPECMQAEMNLVLHSCTWRRPSSAEIAAQAEEYLNGFNTCQTEETGQVDS